jgi:hypothetical protein
MRNDVLQYALSQEAHPTKHRIEDFYQIISKLLGAETYHLDLNLKLYYEWCCQSDLLQTFLGRLCSTAPNLQSLDIFHQSLRCEPSPFLRISEPFCSLKSLKFYSWNWTDEDLELMVPLMPNVERLSVCNLKLKMTNQNQFMRPS